VIDFSKIEASITPSKNLISFGEKDGHLEISSDYPFGESAKLFIDYLEKQFGKKITRITVKYPS